MIRRLAAGAVLASTVSLAMAQSDVPRLRDVVGDRFLIGAAIHSGIINATTGTLAQARALVEYHFNTATLENEHKMYHIQNHPGPYNFEGADAFIAYCEKNNLYPVGHTLVWDLKTPAWVFEGVDRAQLIERMRTYIHTVVGRYKGRIKVWDVVNEAIDGKGEFHNSPWRRIIGPDYIALAFQFAHEADPDALLYYNDNNLITPVKREATVKLVRSLKRAGVPIHGVGDQGHLFSLTPNFANFERTIVDLAATGVRVSFTEVDISTLPAAWKYAGQDINDIIQYREELNPYAKGLPAHIEARQVQAYREMFRIIAKHADKVDRVTFWGVTDAHSWLNNRPVAGRTDYPLLFDRQAQPKTAFHAVVDVLTANQGLHPR